MLTYNSRLLGPLLVVCEDDTVVLDNQIKDYATTLHFHGIREVGRIDQGERVFGPWSVGVPFVTQCPVVVQPAIQLHFQSHEEKSQFPSRKLILSQSC